MFKYVCGKNSILDAIKNHLVFKVIYISRKSDIRFFANQKIELVTTEFLNSLTKANHQGFVGILENAKFFPLDVIAKDNPKTVLILDHLQDQQNLGAILRTANAAGLKHIILPKDRAASISEVTLKISSGGFVGLKFIVVSSLSATITTLKKQGFWIYASALDKKSNSIYDWNPNLPAAIIVGNESKGISKTLLNQADELIYIPMQGTVQSLNVSVATGIILFNFNNRIKENNKNDKKW